MSQDNVKLFPGMRAIQLSDSQLKAQISDGLKEDDYDRLSKEIRILFSFCFKRVYSEDYDVITSTTLRHSGHNERKEHLLSRNITHSQEANTFAQELFNDLLSLRPSPKKTRSFFNAAYIWTRAQELEDLQLLAEAYTQFWRLLDQIKSKAQISDIEIMTILQNNELVYSQSNAFAVKVLHQMDLINGSAAGNIESIALLDRLRHPHVHQPGRDYYLEEDTHLEAEMHNIFIADITKLFVLWEIGLSDYYLKPSANIYELAKNSDN